jgi:anti-sigma factor RsiW
MTEPDRLSPQDRDNLVPFLDGELDEEGTQALEAKLAQSSEARNEVESLKRTWELLDYLPRPRASETFTNRTIEKLETRQMVQARQQRRWRWVGGASWAAGLAAAALVGFLLLHEPPRPEPPEPTAEDVRLYEHRDFWHYYEKIDGLEFLKELERAKLFPEDS